MPHLTFYGATQQVTGSCYLLETEHSRVLLECGLFQGDRKTEALNQRPFPFQPSALNAVVLSHAHLDHSGQLPRLISNGYQGKIILTPATRDLLAIMLKDAAMLQERDAQWQNRRRQRANKRLIEPLYTLEDVEQTLAQCQPLPYGERIKIAADVELCFRDAGHILGSAIVELWAGSGGQQKKLVFSGDLGNPYAPVLPPADTVAAADVLLMESTYGDRDHRSLAQTLEEFSQVLEAANQSGGNVLIPAFAVGRTQEILYRLGELYQAGKLKQQRVFVDSPMAIAATQIYNQHQHLFDPQALATLHENGQQPQDFLPPLRFSHSTEESMAINRIGGGAIIIAGSGMCTGGRILHHLKYNLWRREAHVVIVGFQAQGTPGRALVEGAKRLKLLGEEIAVNASIHTLGGFSAHAGQSQLVRWAGEFTTTRPRLYLVHGEPGAIASLSERIKTEYHWQAQIPDAGKRIAL